MQFVQYFFSNGEFSFWLFLLESWSNVLIYFVLDPDESEIRHVPLRKTQTISLDRKHVIEAKLFLSGREHENVISRQRRTACPADGKALNLLLRHKWPIIISLEGDGDYDE